MMQRMNVIDTLAQTAAALHLDDRLIPMTRTTKFLCAQIQTLLQRIIKNDPVSTKFLLEHLSLLINLLGSETGVTTTILLLLTDWQTVNRISIPQVHIFHLIPYVGEYH